MIRKENTADQSPAEAPAGCSSLKALMQTRFADRNWLHSHEARLERRWWPGVVFHWRGFCSGFMQSSNLQFCLQLEWKTENELMKFDPSTTSSSCAAPPATKYFQSAVGFADC